MGSISRRRHSVERPSSRSASKWFGTSSRVRANQNAATPVSTRPLSGISVGKTTSKVEIRSLATSSSRSSSSAYSSRTFPLPTCAAASGIGGLSFPGAHERVQALEYGVDVTGVRVERKDGVEVEARRELAVRAHELAEILLGFPRAHRVLLDEPVGIVAREPALHECEQHALAEEERMRGIDVAAHPFGEDDEPLDEPGEPVERVVEREKRVREDDSLRRRVRDVALVPECNVLEPDHRRR